MNLHRIAAVASKEWRETIRDRAFLALAFLIPIVWMVVFGYGMVFDVENIPYAVFDHDQSALSRDYLSRFQHSRYFAFKGVVGSDREVDALLARGTVRAVIIVPDKFQERLLQGRAVGVQTLLDGTFPMRSDITKGYVIAINADFSQEMLVPYLAKRERLSLDQARTLTEPVRLEVRYLYNQEVRSAWTIPPALVMLVLALFPPLLTALGIVREKERGSIYNIYSSTVTPGEFLTGKLLPYMVISGVNVLMLWALAVYLFGAPFKGNPIFFFFASMLFVLCTTGIGLVVSMFVRTQQAALIITLLISIVPTMNYSGMLVPVSSLTGGAQLMSRLFPSMYYTNIVRGTFLKGVGWDVLWADVLMLAVYAVALRVLAYRCFTKRPAA